MKYEDNKMKITGLSLDWRSIGEYLDNMKNSIFFNQKSIKYSKPVGFVFSEEEARFESFQVEIDIERFE